MESHRQHLIESIRDSTLGEDHALEGPFGVRRVTYADYTASGRALSFLESFIRDEVLPLYANTHTETSGTGLQTTRFREDARRILRRAVGAGDDDAVVFCGSGATAAVNRLVGVLGLRLPAELDERYGLSGHIPPEERPVVLIGPYEHHSNELPWRESIAEVVVVDEDADGRIDLAHLRRELERFADRPLKIGSFSAASNVTGIESDVDAVTALLHEHGALAFWDYAAAAPYVRIDMSGGDDERRRKDAVFLSPHKLVGGPGTPGVLVARRSLFKNRVPSVPGGGTVAYVSAAGHRYLEDVEHREEGGTPAIVESIRAGLVFQLKAAVGADTIEELEHGFLRRAIARWGKNPYLRILGNPHAPRLSIVSFMVRHPHGSPRHEYLHHNFVVALLNDLFGVQARGGCSCAGPYGHRLLGIDLVKSKEYEKAILRGCEGIKPGWVRLNFNYFISEAVFQYLLAVVDWLAWEAWKLLPLYRFEHGSGLWRHRMRQHPPAMSLEDVAYVTGRMEFRSRHATEPESALPGYLKDAGSLLERLGELYADLQIEPEELPEDVEKLRWFPLPSEVLTRSRPAVEEALRAR